jgi:hypothetical protein
MAGKAQEDSSWRCSLANGDALFCLPPGGGMPSIGTRRAATLVQFLFLFYGTPPRLPFANGALPQMALYRNKFQI